MLRPYDPARDRAACLRIWRELGWAEKEHEDAAVTWFECGRALVAELHGAAECLTLSCPGALRHLADDLPLGVVTGVTTSRVGRQQGFATALTARLIAADAAEGALVQTLGVFDQGFYDRLGFGPGAYGHLVVCDPRDLRVDRPTRAPVRLSANDGAELHACRLARYRAHGGCNLLPVATTASELVDDDAFGLGFRDAGGTLTHAVWARADTERQSCRVEILAWRTRSELHELLALLRGLGEEFKSVELLEPPGVQLQDLLRRPFRAGELTKGSAHASGIRAGAGKQFRLNHLPGALAATHLPGPSVRCNLALSDSVRDHLPPDSPWRGVGGAWRIVLGPESSASAGHDPALPTLQASVGAFTRLWLGVRSATGLALTDDLAGPPELLAALDATLRLPAPHPDWSY
jgi:hypothetical protein